MYFLLFKSFDNVKFDSYGPYVDNPEQDDNVIYYLLDYQWDDVELFDEDIDEINTRCNSLLGIGDVDFLKKEQCILLDKWIEERINKPINNRYLEILLKLKSFCKLAIQYNTGVKIDL